MLNSVLIVNEVFCEAKHRKKPTLVFKVDYEKVYDSVRWDFLLYIQKAITNIYAPCDLEGKNRLWEDLLSWKARSNCLNWCLLGDFNTVRAPSERRELALALPYVYGRPIALILSLRLLNYVISLCWGRSSLGLDPIAKR